MWSLTEPPALLSLELSSVSLLLGAAVQGAVLLTVAFLVTLLLRKASAAVRHLVWILSLGAVLILPALSFLLPPWNVLPAWMDASRLLTVESHLSVDTEAGRDSSGEWVLSELRRRSPGELPAGREEGAGSPGPESPSPGATETGSGREHRTLVLGRRTIVVFLIVWGAGAAVLSLRIVASQLALRNLALRSRLLTSGRPYSMMQELRHEVGIERKVRVLLSSCRRMPMTWGVFKSYSLLPAEAEDWGGERLRAVLLHELSHVKRRDNAVQLLVHAVCALHWFNPLIWLAAWRIHVERECACDDFVLNSGLKASDYAAHLLGVVTGHESRGLSGATALGMAKKARLESRLVRVLDGRIDRKGLSIRSFAIAFLITGASVIALGMMRAEQPEGPPEVRPVREASREPAPPASVRGESRSDRSGKGKAESSTEDMTSRDFGRGCFQSGCHAGLGKTAFVHGPVAVGACSDCHQPGVDVAKHEFDFKRSGDQLCTTCHLPSAPDKIHETTVEGACLDCHDPHGGSNRDLTRALRVLYMEGAPRWEYRFLRNILQREKYIDVQCFLTSADPDTRQESDEEPYPLKALFDRPEVLFGFDVIILGDLPGDLMGNHPRLPALLRKFVREKGGGVVALAGSAFTAPAGIAELLPVLLEHPPPPSQDSEFSPRLTPRGIRHEMLRLVDDPEENRRLWEKGLPALQRYRRIAAVKAGSEVLCVHPGVNGGQDTRPLMVLARAGRGRSLFISTDTLWHWRAGEPKYYERFWKRVVTYMACGPQKGE